MSAKYIPIATRFWQKVVKEDSCWLWTGCRTDRDYGSFWVNRRHHQAHRVAWFLAEGTWPPKEMEVCHSCDVANCVRRDHLFLGTHFDNMRDCAAKGRNAMQKHPERSYLHRRTKEQRTAAGKLGWEAMQRSMAAQAIAGVGEEK